MSTNIERNLKKLLRGKKACALGILGQGEYGKVFQGGINNNGRRFVAYKEIDTKKNSLGSAAFEL